MVALSRGAAANTRFSVGLLDVATRCVGVKPCNLENIAMGRLIRKPQGPDQLADAAGLDDIFAPEPQAAAVPAARVEPGDGYLDRMLKYIPAETIAFSMVINAILDQAIRTSGTDALMAGLPVTTVAWAALATGWMLTPVLCWYLHKDGDAWIVNAAMSTVAFPFWAYLMDAVAFAQFHDGDLAAILVLTFTVVSGLVAPSSRRRARQHEQHPVTSDRPRLVAGSSLRERVTEMFAAAKAPDA
jgi:hypothetical protein